MAHVKGDKFGSPVVNIDADEVDYDNTTSGLAAEKVQAAIDEIDATVDALGTASHAAVTLKSPDAPTTESLKLSGQELEAEPATGSTHGVMTPTDKTNLDQNTTDRHTHSNKALLDTYTQTEADIADAISKEHEHANKALLDTYSQTEADIADAISKEHVHSNLVELEKVTDGDHDVRTDDPHDVQSNQVTHNVTSVETTLLSLREKWRYSKFPIKGVVAGTLCKDWVGGETKVFADFGNTYGPEFDITDPSGVIDYHATDGIVKTGTDNGTNRIDFDSIVAGWGSATSIGYFSLCRVDSAALHAHFRFGLSGSKYAYLGFNAGKHFINIRNDVPASQTATFPSAGVASQWIMLYAEWKTDGTLTGYALQADGLYETCTHAAGACTWIQSATYARALYDDVQSMKNGFIIIDNPWSEEDFRNACRAIHPAIVEDGIPFDLGPIGDYPMEILGGQVANPIAFGVTEYSSILATSGRSIEVEAQHRVRTYGTIKNFEVYCSSNTLDSTLVLTLRKNGANQTVTVTFAATGTGWQTDLSNSFDFVPGDLLSIGFVASGTAGTATISNISLGVIQK